MTDLLDSKIRQLVHELSDAAPSPRTWDQLDRTRSGAAHASRPTWPRLVAAAAVITGVIAVGVVIGRPRSSNPPAIESPDTGSASAPSSSAPSSSTASTASPSSNVPTTFEPVPLVAPISVSYQQLPPLLGVSPIATAHVPVGSAGPGGVPAVAVLDGGRMAIIDDVEREIVVVQQGQAEVRVPLELDNVPFLVTGGPGDLIYGIVQTPTPQNAAGATMVAIALSGSRAGAVVESAPIDINPYTEVAPTVLGHGAAGIIDRRTGELLLPYLDSNGDSIGLDQPSPNYALDDDGTITDETDIVRWTIDIERDPAWPGTYVTDPPPAATGNGHAIYWTSLGPAADPTQDIGVATIPVIAQLDPGGTGTWYRLPAGWSVAASDLWGVVVVRRVDDEVEVARLAVEATPSGSDWTAVAPPPDPWAVANFGSFSRGHTAIGIGGATAGNNLVETFDADTGAWTSQPSPLSPSGGDGRAAGAVAGDLIVLRDGAFDLSTMEWRTDFPAQLDPNDRMWSAAWTGSEVIFLPAGLAYDPEANTWRRIADTPSDLAGSDPVWTGSRLVAAQRMGGWFAYDPTADTWTELSTSHAPVATQMSSLWDGNRVVVLSPDGSMHAYQPTHRAWAELPAAPLGDCVAMPQLLLVAGRLTVRSMCDGATLQILGADGWQQHPYPTDAIVHAACPALSLGDRLYDPCGNLMFTPSGP